MVATDRLRLSVMMFFQYFVLGSTVPILSLYLTRYLLFSGIQAGMIMSMAAVAAFVSPLAGAFIADRVIRAERLFGFCHLLGGVLMAILSFQTRFSPFLVIYLAYMMIFGPTIALSNAITFHHLPHAVKNFGGIRMWGTIGWIAVAWIFGFIWLKGSGDLVTSRLPDALKLSSMASIILGLFSFCLPQRRVRFDGRKPLMPSEAFRVMVNRNVLLLLGFSFLIAVIDRYYFFGTGPFLSSIGFSNSLIMPAMSIGQLPEIFAMGLLGFFLVRLGQKRVLSIGVVMELARFISFSIGAPKLLVLMGISFHGIAFAFFFSTAYIYLDNHCTKESRAGVHQLYSIITSGIGSFIGNLAAGKTMDFYTLENNSVDFQSFWMVPAAISLITLLLLLLFFLVYLQVQIIPFRALP